jgi:1-acyl-sn-glycerol-3-phosphate acyltransferase
LSSASLAGSAGSNGLHPLSSSLAALVRLATGVQVRWQGCAPDLRQRIYIANHTSHLDAVVLWGALPPAMRARTRPVAARDYWDRGPVRRWLARRVFRVVLIDRGGAGTESKLSAARASIETLVAELGTRDSLIVFPEGTRGDGQDVGPFKSGIYHLAERVPGLELVPAWMENLNRVLPKGEVLPVPIACSVTFGAPFHVREGEAKADFLLRAREAVRSLRPA